jgi:hypothetical protein
MSGEKRKAVQVNVQLYGPELAQIEGWRKAQPGFPSRAAALRNFINLGLRASADIPAAKAVITKGQAA